jgi:hypothetical protein
MASAEALVRLSHWLLRAGDDEAELQAAGARELVTLSSAHFDAAKADALLDGRSPDTVPSDALPWLDQLLQQPQWRELIYSLHAQHVGSTFVHLALLRLLQSDHAVEARSRVQGANAVTSLGGSSVRHLLDSLPEVLAARLACAPGASAQLLSLCSLDEASAAYAAVLLGGMQAAAGSAVSPALAGLLRHVRAEAAAAAAAKGIGSARFDLLACGVAAHSPLMTCCLSMLKLEQLSPADVIAFRSAAVRSRGYELVALLRAGRSAELLRPLLSSLFGARLGTGPRPAAPHGDVRGALLDVLATLSSGHPAAEQPDPAWSAARGLLDEASLVCTLPRRGDILPHAPRLISACADPAAAVGLMLWSHSRLAGMHAGGEAAFDEELAAVHVAVVMAAAARHPWLQPQASAVLGAWLCLDASDETDPRTAHALKRKLIDCTLSLMARGCAAAGLATLVRFAGVETDRHLLRHACLRLLSLAAPPYEAWFGVRLVGLLNLPGMQEAVRTAPAAQRELIVGAVRQLSLGHPLVAEAAAWLDGMKRGEEESVGGARG